MLIRKLWTKPRVTHIGRYYTVKKAVVAPRPLQRPCPPIWYGGESMASMRLASRVANGWLFGDSTIPEATRRVRTFRRLTRRRVPIGMMIGVWPRRARRQEPRKVESPQRAYLSGNGDEIAESAAAFRSAGLSLLILKFHPTLAGLRRFAREVLPSL